MSKILSLSLAATIPAIYAQAANAEYLNRPAVAAEQSSGSAAISPTRFETVPPNEAGQIGEIIDLTTQLLQQRYPNSMARRGVHPKDHGCVQASFAVNSDIAEKYRIGVFAKPAQTYQAWIRFSNATGLVTPDVGANGAATGRGMAIKLMGVEGSTLLDEPGARTQDFLLINQPMFAFANVSAYLEVTKLQRLHHDDNAKIFGALLDPKTMTPEKMATAKIVGLIGQTPLGNPLDSRYFSASAFLFGKDMVAKFGVTPRDPAKPSLPPANPSPNYLREALKKNLDIASGKPAVFDFQVQLRTNDLPIEDASAEWKEANAPFQNVAVLTIHQQDFDNPLRITECEHLVFTPWHGLTEHQPLGGINRLRLGVYTASSQYRAQAREPSGFPKWPW